MDAKEYIEQEGIVTEWPHGDYEMADALAEFAEELQTELEAAEARIAELERVLRMVEFERIEYPPGTVRYICYWCGEEKHVPDCPRQKALGL